MSYDDSAIFKIAKGDGIELEFFAGSYNADNTPEYGNYWEYYHINLNQKTKCKKLEDAISKFKELKGQYGLIQTIGGKRVPDDWQEAQGGDYKLVLSGEIDRNEEIYFLVGLYREQEFENFKEGDIEFKKLVKKHQLKITDIFEDAIADVNKVIK